MRQRSSCSCRPSGSRFFSTRRLCPSLLARPSSSGSRDLVAVTTLSCILLTKALRQLLVLVYATCGHPLMSSPTFQFKSTVFSIVFQLTSKECAVRVISVYFVHFSLQILHLLFCCLAILKSSTKSVFVKNMCQDPAKKCT